MWLGSAKKWVVLTVFLSLGAMFPEVAKAQVIVVGGQSCVQEYAWYDYYTNGQLTDSLYEPDGITCYDNGGVAGIGGDWGYGGGGAGSSQNFPDLEISTQLKCALDKYLHSNVKLTGGRTMRKVNAWAFGKKNADGVWGYKIKGENVSPGANWTPAAGIATPGTAYGRLYNRAFQASANFPRQGSRPNATSNSLSGSISEFEMSLFAGAHEASHLLGNLDENEADWYGINAVLSYRGDGGAKCH